MTVETEELFCEACGDPADTLDDQQRGRCCRNLPHPWHRGSDGLYNRPSDSDDAEDEDVDESEQAPTCHSCGSRTFIVTATQRVRTGTEDGDFIFYDTGDMEVEARCAVCDTPPRHLALEHA